MWWGGFSERCAEEGKGVEVSLNPHVVGRFFRGEIFTSKKFLRVLIPMWWGGFSERKRDEYH